MPPAEAETPLGSVLDRLGSVGGPELEKLPGWAVQNGGEEEGKGRLAQRARFLMSEWLEGRHG